MSVIAVTLSFFVAVLLSGCTRGVVPDGSNSTQPKLDWPLTQTQTAGNEFAEVSTDNATLTLAIADTEAERTKGLGYRDTLPQDGMLFVIDPAAQTSIWMKGMRFELDVAWLRDGRIVHVQESMPLAAASDPAPPTYGPSEPVDAIIEIAAGSARENGFVVGQLVELKGLR